MSATPEFLLFDLGNVLLHFDHRLACRQIAAVSGVEADQVWDIIFGSDLQHRYEIGEVTDEQYYDAFCAASGTKPDEGAFERAGSDIFEINVRIVPIVAQLRSAGHRTGILSNTSAAHWRHVSGGRFALVPDYFELTVLSFEIGAMKPDQRAFEVAADRAGVSPGGIFFTDDRPENVAAAKEAGFDAVAYESPESLAQELCARGIRFNY